jgi:hypothetical protein
MVALAATLRYGDSPNRFIGVVARNPNMFALLAPFFWRVGPKWRIKVMGSLMMWENDIESS